MHWQRRRDLEGGKELGIWLLLDDGTVAQELYVETHQYRGGDFDVYTATPAGDWEHKGSYKTVKEAFETARAYIEHSQFPLAGP